MARRRLTDFGLLYFTSYILRTNLRTHWPSVRRQKAPGTQQRIFSRFPSSQRKYFFPCAAHQQLATHDWSWETTSMIGSFTGSRFTSQFVNQ